MIPAVIVCHGSLGEAYLQALSAIYGECSMLTAISNTGLSAEALDAAVAESVRGFDQGILFTDYFGGSCATACLSEVNRHPGLRIVSGVNLPILLYYLAHRHELDIEALVRGILHRGQNSIRELVPPKL
jgi:mannose/fructose-specific phosphotransferase system component IIA